jgi:hypothetical protein
VHGKRPSWEHEKRIACYGARDTEKEQFDDTAISMMGYRDRQPAAMMSG